ncbi:hybrid sensor histidine kinase/response regulator [Marinicrinis sediminis]|uniref:histidine kinase n=1 Tax=Marinicrinis sediminis TaxID=1652465 RepID=A0ABW5R898_9BACL
MLHSLKPKHVGIIGSILLIFMTLLLIAYAQLLPNRDAPRAERGQLDLSNWNFEAAGQVYLNGQWEFYEELLYPADFTARTPGHPSYLSVPGIWTGKTRNEGMDRRGYGTYRLTMKLNEADKVFGLKTKNIRMSHRLYINGQLMGESGTPAAGVATYKPGNTPYTVFFQNDTNEVEVVLQVANYHFPTGGVVNAISFGLQQDLIIQSGMEFGLDLGIIIMLAIFSVYHLGLYILVRRDKSYLLIGLFLLSCVCFHLLYGEKIFQRMFPDFSFVLTYKLIELSIFSIFTLFIMILFSVNDRLLSSEKLKWVVTPLVMYLVTVVVAPYTWHMDVRYLLFLYMGLIFLYFIIKGIVFFPRTAYDSADRIEVLLFIAGNVSIIVFIVSGLLYSENMIPHDLAGKGGLVSFIIIINILLMIRFSNAYDKNELLTQQLRMSNQLKDEFLTSTSHELKTPLHGILNTAAHMLEDEQQPLSDKQRHHLYLIKDTATKLSMLIRDLLDVTQLKHGQLRLNRAAVEVKVAVQMVLELLQFELTGKKVTLINSVEPNIWVHADENRIRQVLYNIVSNAIKHTEEGTIQVTAHVEASQTSIAVTDTGAGMTNDQHERIFDYFVRLDESRLQDDSSGAGVGLYISRKLLELMGGEIWVDWSEVGQGTRMKFTLPSNPFPESLSEATAATAATAAEYPKQVRNYPNKELDIIEVHDHTILIVDDEPSNIQVLLNVLSSSYNVLTAFSAKEAMDKLRQHHDVDLVILDVMMPSTSGIELCRTLRASNTLLELPILLATVKDAPQDIMIGFDAGANDYVTKPFEGNTLLARIQTLISVKTSLQEALQNEYAFYQAQIKPHFLYNALSSVISFCYTDGEKAAHLLSRISQYLQTILELDRSVQYVPLQQELELIEAYVEIEEARFGDRFEFHMHVDKSLQNVTIPTLCIQPFVENAIRHGLFKKEGRGKGVLCMKDQGDRIQIKIEDNGVGMSQAHIASIFEDKQVGRGIGIVNIRKRMQAISGAELKLYSEPGSGTIVTLLLPK